MGKTITSDPDQATVTMKKIVVRRTGPVRLTSASCYGYGRCCCIPRIVGGDGGE